MQYNRTKRKELSPTSRTAWYQDRKKKRMADEANSRREWGSTQISVKETNAQGTEEKELDNYITFEQWAAPQMALGRYATEAKAWAAYETLLENPAYTKVFRRGQWLLGEYSGIQMAKVKNNMLTSENNLSSQITSKEQFDNMTAAAEQQMKRKESQIGVSYKPMESYTPPSQHPTVEPGDVSGDIVLGLGPSTLQMTMTRALVKKENDAMRDEEEALAEAKLAMDDKIEHATKEKTVFLSAEKLSLKIVINTAKGKLDNLSSNLKSQVAIMCSESEAMTQDPDGKQQVLQKVNECNALIADVDVLVMTVSDAWLAKVDASGLSLEERVYPRLKQPPLPAKRGKHIK